MTLPFLLEIGAEEIPDWMIPPALENLLLLFEKLNLPHETVLLDATPRRLVLRVEGLPERLPDSETRILGPAKSAPPLAVMGFARKHGLKPEDLVVESTPKGEHYVFTKKVEGRRTIDILAEALPGIVLGIYFPKTMYWTAKNGPRFIRPIRWLVALLGAETVPFEIAGVRSGNLTAGHRRLGAKEIVVTVADFEQRLRDHYVILSAEERRSRIRGHFANTRVKPDPALLETLVYLTEYPTPITGSFDPRYLELPEEVLVTVMRHHQKYFSVEDAEGKLAPQFVAVMNIPSDPEGFVRGGNERVLRARFNDARFFWETDQKKKLIDRRADLAHVTFQAKLGSYLEKTERNIALTRELGGDAFAERAAGMLKCDLTTELVKEFTDLQGVIGGLYARAQGEPDPVWQAIYDQYKPASLEDSIPRHRTAQIVALADKLDTLRGCFSIGLIPTGSRDPFALRRAAQAVVKILVEGKLEISLLDFLRGDEPGAPSQIPDPASEASLLPGPLTRDPQPSERSEPGPRPQTPDLASEASPLPGPPTPDPQPRERSELGPRPDTPDRASEASPLLQPPTPDLPPRERSEPGTRPQTSDRASEASPLPQPPTPDPRPRERSDPLISFFEDRVKFYFKDYRGFAYDEINAAMAPGWSNLPDLEARLIRIRNLRSTPDFEPLAASFKRIRNILEQAKFTGGGAVDPAFLEPGPEKDLYDEYRRTHGQPVETTISKLRPRIDLFFDKVLVNAPDARVRQNRLTLLETLLREFSAIADFSEIVTSS